jgi:hypothetical protein
MQHDGADVRVGTDASDRLDQLIDHARVQGVALARAIQHEPRHATLHLVVERFEGRHAREVA